MPRWRRTIHRPRRSPRSGGPRPPGNLGHHLGHRVLLVVGRDHDRQRRPPLRGVGGQKRLGDIPLDGIKLVPSRAPGRWRRSRIDVTAGLPRRRPRQPRRRGPAPTTRPKRPEGHPRMCSADPTRQLGPHSDPRSRPASLRGRAEPCSTSIWAPVTRRTASTTSSTDSDCPAPITVGAAQRSSVNASLHGGMTWQHGRSREPAGRRHRSRTSCPAGGAHQPGDDAVLGLIPGPYGLGMQAKVQHRRAADARDPARRRRSRSTATAPRCAITSTPPTCVPAFGWR